ncbi:MAG: LysR family transcriptional regulator [Elusimicrobia bacterium]|nr:LysR family transcriptional regulator [Elusimicrobiota bacterium]
MTKAGLRLRISLTNAEGEPFMGIGLIWLLERIRRLKSIKLAAKDMGMSCMKAHGILRRLEENLGRRLLIRRKGGYDRGGAELTPFAEEFLADFNKRQSRVESCARREFTGLLKGLGR